MERIKKYFQEPLLPTTAFQITSRYISGIHISSKEKKIRSHFILPLESGIIQPSFTKRNITNPSLLEKKMREELKRYPISDHKIACLIPELSLKAFVFSFDSLPPSLDERERIIRFRMKKQIPMLPDDVRFSFDTIRTNNSDKIFASVVRIPVIHEYEDFFGQFHLKVGVVGVPTISLYNLMMKKEEKDFILINIEEDFLSLAVIINSEIVLYRLKPFALDSRSDVSEDFTVENVVKEVENTVNFIEDREKKKVHSLWVRFGGIRSEEEQFSILKEKLRFNLRGIEEHLPFKLGVREKNILSPVIGQVL